MGSCWRFSDPDGRGGYGDRIALGSSERVPLVRWISRGRGLVDVLYRFTRSASRCCGTGSLRSRAAGRNGTGVYTAAATAPERPMGRSGACWRSQSIWGNGPSGDTADATVLGAADETSRDSARWISRGRGLVDVRYRFTRSASRCCGTGSLRSRAAGRIATGVYTAARRLPERGMRRSGACSSSRSIGRSGLRDDAATATVYRNIR